MKVRFISTRGTGSSISRFSPGRKAQLFKNDEMARRRWRSFIPVGLEKGVLLRGMFYSSMSIIKEFIALELKALSVQLDPGNYERTLLKSHTISLNS